MPTIIFERAKSRSGTVAVDPTRSNAALEYIVFGTADEDEVAELVAETIPDSYAGLVYQDFSITPITPDAWEVLVHYDNTLRRNIGDNFYSFEFGTGTQHITQSLETISRTGMHGDADPPDVKQAINVTTEGVGGCDIISPQSSFRVTIYREDGKVDEEYLKLLHSYVGKVNDAAFMGYKANELLLAGVSGSRRSQADWEITFQFSVSLETLIVVDIEDGESVTVEKGGWHYAWFSYKTVQVGTRLVQQPTGVYVERVYEAKDFTKLGTSY